jgi:hypothetical protein
MSSNRITQKDLEVLVKDINNLSGFENPTYRTVGSYQLSYAYGGVKLVKIGNESGGQTTVSNSGYGTKRELYIFLRGFLNGLDK